MERSISLVFLVWIMLLNGCLWVEPVGSSKVGRLKMIHRHSPKLGENTGTSLGVPENPKECLKQLLHSDRARSLVISQKLGKLKNHIILGAKNLVEFPMRSAADLGKGQYFVSVRVGTPPKRYLLLVDTGSTLTWIVCKHQCRDCWHDRFLSNLRVFQPKESSTYCPILCNTEFCDVDLRQFNTNNNICPTPQSSCFYEYGYLDGTLATGYMGNDTVKIRLNGGKKVKLSNITFGCTESISNTEKFGHIDGILGLGCNDHSFAVRAAQAFGDKFSYCLVDHLSRVNVVNFLFFGEVGPAGDVPNMQHTELILGVLASFYALNVTGISVDDKMLDIPSYVWTIDGKTNTGGTILDSGSSLTYLVEPAYNKVISALLPSLSRYPKVETEDMEYCFLSEGFDKKLIPRLAIHFADGAKFEPPVKSYIIDFSPKVKCLGFKSIPWPDISIIGNILQQNHLWEFDLLNQKLSFGPSSCIFDNL